MEVLFKIAEASAHGILYLMGVLSVVSVAIMIERYLSLKKVSSSSSTMAKEFRNVIGSQDISKIENLSKNLGSLEGQALGYGLNYVQRHGAEGLDELINSFKSVERPLLEKN